MPATDGRRLLRLGTVLVLFGLLTGLAVPFARVPRLGLSTHIGGVLGGVTLLVLGLLWPQLRLSPGASRGGRLLAAYAFYVAWLMPLLAAVWGAGAEALPFAAGSARGTPLQENVITLGLTSSAAAVITLFVLVLWGLRDTRTAR